MSESAGESPLASAAAASDRPVVGWLVTLWKRAFFALGAPYLTRAARLDAERHQRLAVRLDEGAGRVDRLTAAVEALGQAVRLHANATHASPGASGTAAAAPPALPEETYFAFEEAFRGAESQVSARQRIWVDEFLGHGPILDIGCGRGEFLELLRVAGLAASGVDASAWMVERCREKGLEAIRIDALTHLRGVPAASLGGVFAAHVVEHLQPAALVELLAQVARVLRPGGCFVAETPNGTSVAVLARGFYRDPTHLRPVHPETLAHLARSAGFASAEIRFLEPFPAEERLPPAPALSTAEPEASRRFAAAWDRLDALLYGHQDYALIARR